MAWQELLDSIEKSMSEELDEMLKSAEDKKKKSLAAAEANARKLQDEARGESERAARLLHDEIISGGRIQSKNILRKAHLHEINAVYDAFKEKLMASSDLKKKILIDFIEKNATGAPEAEVSAEVYSLLKGADFSKKIKLVKKNTDCPVIINMDKIVMNFDWDEFLQKFKAATIRKVSEDGAGA
ncbi:MAG: hypothetical protein Q7J59_04200 [Elusimicrobiota bacterium]|nr:hypothetical protein [Elusimicrobiota bacterium]